MAKKHSPKDTSDVVFDTHSKMVMSQGGTFGRMKEKINAVRAVVPNRSNNEIVLVLQHFENCVDHAVQAFVEGSAAEILKEWNVTGKKKPKKKKKPKPQTGSQTDSVQAECTSPSDGKDAVNGLHGNGSGLDGDSADSLSEQLDSASLDTVELDCRSAVSELTEPAAGTGMDFKRIAPNPASGGGQGGQRGKAVLRPSGSKARFTAGCSVQPASSSAPPSAENGQNASAVNKKIAPNIDKSVKDLHRCTASLTRYRVVVKDEMDSSIKRMKQTFSELQSCLMDREVALLAEMDKVKAEAMAILDARQKKAEDLRRLSEQSSSMTEDQLGELRADIKHFVSERKYDEDLGKAVKFTHDLESLRKSIMSFGQVYHPQTGYSSRSLCSSASSPLVGSAKPGMQVLPHGSAQPLRPAHQSGVRPAQGLAQQPGAQSMNGGPHLDRNLSRPHYRNQNNRGQMAAPDSASHPAPLTLGARNGLVHTATSVPRHFNTTPNGLPQRRPREHRP
ncbi:spermatogenesis-associated serine-rich protein 2-like [Paramormyrops kingsleyae]|uniref:Spermatogenesis-associated serine-rich protein 2-like n=1 Tax=Paramormyrops kingsleyae TaxID=1676925 RepID=A0A3B3RLV0_9TELE|nr:spermatogenesis-associated serine-rich protein 2-like [Paramormyrops kingsleyae]XP_023687193.1 spermatogenesis-associated serine-rich protein 2-like [Paramormyrops kingsleyae]